MFSCHLCPGVCYIAISYIPKSKAALGPIVLVTPNLKIADCIVGTVAIFYSEWLVNQNLLRWFHFCIGNVWGIGMLENHLEEF